jgi:hypothetical protein
MNKTDLLKKLVIDMFKVNKNLTFKDVLTNKEILKLYNCKRSLVKRLNENHIRGKTFTNDMNNLMKNKNTKKIVIDKNNIKHEKIEESKEEFNKKEALDMFKKQYHKKTINLEKVKNGIDKYLKVRGWIPDTEFKQLCGITSIDWRYIKEQYPDMQIKVDNQTIWGHRSIIKDMKKIIESNASLY